MEEKYKISIAKEFEQCVRSTIKRLDNADTNRPFHEALLSKEALFWSRFERSFSTSFGQRVVEQISKIAALSGGADEANNQVVTECNLSAIDLAEIESHISDIRQGRLNRGPNWIQDLDRVTYKLESNVKNITERVRSDLWWRKNGVNNYMSIKTVKPNIDQTAEAKRDLLKLKLNDPTCNVYYGLYYNPYGENRTDYAWSPPRGVFDFHNDAVILIGREYWELLGGPGFYEEIIAIANECGTRTRPSIEGLMK